MPKRAMEKDARESATSAAATTTPTDSAGGDGAGSPGKKKRKEQEDPEQQQEAKADAPATDSESKDASGHRGGARGGRSAGPAFTDPPVSEQTPVQKMFIGFRELIDEEYARAERVYKVSRDVTKGGKDVISFLHRIPLNAQSGVPPYANTSDEAVKLHLQEANKQLREVEKLIEEITSEFTKDEHYWMLNKKYSFGLQEYIEAASYYTYLLESRLITRADVEARITAANSQQTPFILSVYDYLLGVGDLTGELMRFSINSVGQGNVAVADHVRNFIRDMHDAFSTLAEANQRELGKKTKVMKESMEKVELVCYKLRLRKAEFPDEDAAALAKYLAKADSKDGGAEQMED